MDAAFRQGKAHGKKVAMRAEDCGGAVKVMGKNSKTGGQPFVEHKDPKDAEFCANGMGFRKATDGREAKPSENPVA